LTALQSDGLVAGRDRDLAANHEHAERAVAGTDEELRTARGDPAEARLKLGRIVATIE
jgi:hypothetical protein